MADQNNDDDPRPRILCIDDDPEILSFVVSLLEDEYRPLGFSCGKEVLDHVNQDPDPSTIGLIICDQLLPDSKGTELLRKLRQTMPRARRLLITGALSHEVLQKSINEAQIWRYLEKPFRGKELRLMVRDALESWKLEVDNARLMAGLRRINAGLEEKVREKTAESGMLLRIVCHDLANPLAIITGSAIILEKLITDPLVQPHVARFSRATKHMGDILSEVRELQSIADGKLSGRMEDYPLGALVDHLQLMFGDVLEEKKVELVCNLPEEHLVYCDPLLLKSSIVGNLVSNAIKFSHPGGRIHVESRLNGECIELQVRDEGIGIPDDLLTRLFNPTARTNRKGTGQEAGTGYGMPIAHAAVEVCGGQIKVDSSTGEDGHPTGTTFTVFLPANKQAWLRKAS